MSSKGATRLHRRLDRRASRTLAPFMAPGGLVMAPGGLAMATGDALPFAGRRIRPGAPRAGWRPQPVGAVGG